MNCSFIKYLQNQRKANELNYVDTLIDAVDSNRA